MLAQRLEGKNKIFHHLDFYRLTKSEIIGIGVQDYLTGQGEIAPGVVLIEWAERCKEVWPAHRLEIRMKIVPDSTTREIVFTGVGPRYEKIVRQLKKKK